jgi:alpha-tubulin suppressor-like RCC1 family protein
MKISSMTFLVCCLLTIGQCVEAAPSGYVIEWGRHDNFTGTAIPATLVLSKTVAISAGVLQCLALKDDGTVDSWSWNRKGEITFDNIVESSSGEIDGKAFQTTRIITNGVVKINGQVLNHIISVAIGSEFGIALKRDGAVIGWGENSTLNCPSNVVAIAVASFNSLALKNDGTVIQWWGAKWLPDYGQLNEVPGLTNVIAVAIGETTQGTRNVALKSDGTVAHWGSESLHKEATPPAGLSNVVAIAAGNNHTLAVKQDGTVIGWGGNDAGQATGIPTRESPYISSGQVMLGGQILSNVLSVAANYGYSMALKKDGTVVAWGKMMNNFYPATVPDGLDGVVAIAAGEDYCLAITTNAAVAEKFQRK